MNVLSLFDGISCGYLALQRAGIPIGTYYASEIDKTCIKVSQKHFPNIIQLGDVNNWRTWDIPWKDIDLVMGGFCARASLAQVRVKDSWTLVEGFSFASRTS